MRLNLANACKSDLVKEGFACSAVLAAKRSVGASSYKAPRSSTSLTYLDIDLSKVKMFIDHFAVLLFSGTHCNNTIQKPTWTASS